MTSRDERRNGAEQRLHPEQGGNADEVDPGVTQNATDMLVGEQSEPPTETHQRNGGDASDGEPLPQRP